MKRQLNCCFFFYMTLTGRHLHLLFKARADQACLLRPFAAKGGTMLQKLSKFEVKAWLSWNWFFYRHSIFTWNPILANSSGPKMSFLAILEVLNFDFSKFEHLSSPKFNKIQSSESLKLPKMTFLDIWIRQDLISRKIGVAVKLTNINKFKP